MATIIEGPLKTFPASGPLMPYRLVKLTPSGLAYPDVGDTTVLGFTEAEAFAPGDLIPVRLRNCEGVCKVQVSTAISINNQCFIGVNGTVAASGSQPVGTALEAASGADAIIEIMPSPAAVFGEVARSSLMEDALQPFPVPYTAFRVWDAPHTNAVGTAGNDDLAVVYNTFGTAPPSVETGDLKAAGATTRRIGFQVMVPPEYVAGQDANVTINAGMKTTISDGTATVDLEVFRLAAPTTDIVATSAQSINSLTPANKVFALTTTDLVPGDILDCRISVAIADTATGTAVIGKIYSVIAKFDIKG